MCNNAAWKIRKRRKKNLAFSTYFRLSQWRNSTDSNHVKLGWLHVVSSIKQTLVSQGRVDEPALLLQHRRVRLFPFTVITWGNRFLPVQTACPVPQVIQDIKGDMPLSCPQSLCALLFAESSVYKSLSHGKVLLFCWGPCSSEVHGTFHTLN